MSKSSKSLHCLVTLLSAENSIDNSITIRTLYTKNISVTATTSKVSPWSRVQTPPRAHELRLHARVTQWSEWGSYEGSLIFANFPLRGVRLGSWQGVFFLVFFPRAIRLCTHHEPRLTASIPHCPLFPHCSSFYSGKSCYGIRVRTVCIPVVL